MSQRNGSQADSKPSDPQDTLLVAGMAMVAIGAGVLMAHPGLREQAKAMLLGAAPELEQALSGDAIGGIVQDIERYMKIRSM